MESQLLEARAWPRQVALERLDDDATAVAAALRLVELDGARPLIAAPPTPASLAVRLRVVKLGEGGWVLGASRGAGPRVDLQSPALIRPDGSIASLCAFGEEELARLCWSEDVERFPHLIVAPRRVLQLDADSGQTSPLVVGDDLDGARFDFDATKSPPEIVLVVDAQPAPPADATARARPVEVARFVWDALEQLFVGPAADAFTDPLAGRFTLDLHHSPGLLAVGGQVSASPANRAPTLRPYLDPNLLAPH